MGRQEQVFLESDNEGRCLALEALRSLVRLDLWPRAADDDKPSRTFIDQELPLLLVDDHAGVRTAAAALWARLTVSYVLFLLLVGQRCDVRFRLPPQFWRQKIIAFMFPFLAGIS